MVIGHECAGVIEEVGSEVKALAAGDRVALEPGISCWRCKHCKGGRYNLCPDMKFFATPPYHGSLANQVYCNELIPSFYSLHGNCSIKCHHCVKDLDFCTILITALRLRLFFYYLN